jgi:NAD(P)-dependent dehydrogenase (short-subunit alcohol dehydrogenase family)
VKATVLLIITISKDITRETHCQQLVQRSITEFGQLDILVNNAAFQMEHSSFMDISSEEFDQTFRTNIYAMFYLSKAAFPHLKPGS